MKRRIDLRKAEAMLLENVERLGLKRVIFHVDTISYRKTTQIFLVKKEDHERWGETDEDKLFPQRKHDILGYGVAHCSWKDVWNRRKGRVIATARALKYMEKRERFQ
jgi:hypothetical protein